MISAFAARFLSFIASLFLAALVIFTVLTLLPGDPAQLMLGMNATPESLAALRVAYGLDQPAALRFVHWLFSLARGDFGISFAYHVPNAALIGDRLVVTVPLACLAFTLTSLGGVGLGCLAARHSSRPLDRLLRLAAALALALPGFWLGLMLMMAFAVRWPLFPAGGFSGWGEGVIQSLHSLVLPAITASLAQMALLMRVTRANVMDVFGEPYMRTARAKGLTRAQSLLRHALPNAALPVLTLMGLQMASLLSGVILVETVFSLPGLGRLLVQAVSQHDVPLVQNLVLLFVAVMLLASFAVDMLCLLIDPRLRDKAERLTP